MNPTTLTFRQALLVFVLMIAWVVIFAVVASTSTSTGLITPALGLFASSALLLLWLIKRYGASAKHSLSMQPTNYRWVLIAVLVGASYWFFDHGLNTLIFEVDQQAAVKDWQTANSHFHWLGVMISTVLLAPLFEELIFRGLLLKALTDQYTFYLAAITTATLFALIHWSWPAFVSLLVVGLVYAVLTKKSGSVIPAIVAHTTHNLITYLVYNA